MAEASPEVRDMLFHKVRADPASFYGAPEEVIADSRFGSEQKAAILQQWRDDLLRFQTGQETGDGLQQVERAMAALGCEKRGERSEKREN